MTIKFRFSVNVRRMFRSVVLKLPQSYYCVYNEPLNWWQAVVYKMEHRKRNCLISGRSHIEHLILLYQKKSNRYFFFFHFNLFDLVDIPGDFRKNCISTKSTMPLFVVICSNGHTVNKR